MPTVFDPVANFHNSAGFCVGRVSNCQKDRASIAGSYKSIGAHFNREKIN